MSSKPSLAVAAFSAVRRTVRAWSSTPKAPGTPATSRTQPTHNPRFQSFSRAPAPEVPVVDAGRYQVYPWLQYDTDNLYPQHLRALLSSATHNSILQAKRGYIVGGGLQYDRDRDPARTVWLDTIGGTDEANSYDINELIRLTAFDLACYGGFAWQILPTPDGRRIAKILHVDFPKVRIGQPGGSWRSYHHDDIIEKLHNIEGDEVSVYWLSADWTYFTNNEFYRPVPVAAFSPARFRRVQATTTAEYGEVVGICPYLLYYNSKSEIIDYYPTPDYIGAIQDIKTEIEISRYHYNNVRNSFAPSIMIAMPDNPGPDEKTAIKEELRQTMQGSENANAILVAWGVTSADGSAQLPTISAVPTTSNADTYAQVDASVQQKIITGHRLTSPTLAGLTGAGGLGGNSSEIATASELFMNTVIAGYQNQILAKLWQVMEVNGFATDDVTLPKSPPVRREYSEDMQRSTMTRAEIRAEMGYEDSDEEPLAASETRAALYADKDTTMTNERRALIGLGALTKNDLQSEYEISQVLQDGVPPTPAPLTPTGVIETPTDNPEINGL